MPDPAEFSFGANITLADLAGELHPLLHQLRSLEPVSWIPAMNGWFITRRDLAIQVMRDAGTFTVDHPSFSTARVVGPSMLSLDGDEHRRHRNPFEAPFRKRAVERRFNTSIADYISERLQKMAATGQAELRRDFAGPVAVHTMLVALGLTNTPIADVIGWYDDIVDAVTRVTAGEPVSANGRAAYANLCEHLRPSLQAPTSSSLLAAAGKMADDLTSAQILSNAAVLLFGGIETTEGMIANALYHLLSHPEVLRTVRNRLHDSHLIESVVEESLRMEPAAAVIDRYTTRAAVLGGVRIGAGELVRVSLAAANRDPYTFPDPDLFDPWRDNLRTHVTFAQGPHVCLGLHLARLEATHALRQALILLPHLRMVETEEARTAARPLGLVFRKPEALHAKWDGGRN